MSAPSLAVLNERMWQRVDKQADGCWVWTGTRWKSRDGGLGYGRLTRGTRPIPVHRYVYELLVGPIPDGLVLDHLCRNPGCVNPAHLEPVTHRENILRGQGAPARHARQRTCLRGHPFKQGMRRRWCPTCDHAWYHARYHA